MKRGKGILLYSGGLDSLLSAKILLDQNIDLIGLHFVLPFVPPDCNLTELSSYSHAKQVGLSIISLKCDKEYLNMVENPLHGYGKCINPCIDCKIHFLKKAKVVMNERDASFVATGEVVGQRPMSQMKHMLNHIEKASELKGYLLRPLSAKLLKPTEAEKSGLVDRDRLYAINGRSRKQQMELADKYNITEYSSPAGGCLLTDKYISRRLKDLFKYHSDYNMIDVYLITVGRHYRLHKNAKIIVSRNEKENIELEKYREYANYFIIPEFKGPLLFVKGRLAGKDISYISSIMRRYGSIDKGDWIVKVYKKRAKPFIRIANETIKDEDLEKIRI